MSLYKRDKSFVLKFFIIILFLFVLFLIVNVIFKSNTQQQQQQEGYSNKNKNKNKNKIEALNNLEIKKMFDFKDSWCKSTGGSDLVKSCLSMSDNDCKSIPCCILANSGNNNVCLAGNKEGPLFKNNKETYDYYIFENNCYGDNCPTDN